MEVGSEVRKEKKNRGKKSKREEYKYDFYKLPSYFFFIRFHHVFWVYRYFILMSKCEH